MVKHELRVTSWKLKSTSWNSKVWVQIHELRVRIHELRVQIHELRVRIHELRVPIHELRAQIHELRVRTHELRVPIHELDFESTRIIKSMKTQVNSLKIPLFPKIISPKLFGNLWGNLNVQFLVIISCFTFPLLHGYGWVSKH